MQQTIRTFVAIKIPAESKLLVQLEKFKRTFENDKIRWVSPDNFHLTLRFIGNTTREQLYNLVDGLEQTCTTIQSFKTEIKGAGYFNNSGKPRVVFVNVCNTEQLIALTNEIEKVVVECGFNKELKPFRPHVTLGRIKYQESRIRFYSVLDELKDVEYQKIEVSEFSLLQSILKPIGPEYKTIKTFKLK